MMEYDFQTAKDYTYIGKGIGLPKYVGGYQIGGQYGLKINLEKKPIWLHRTMMKLCLGWEWIDISN